ncbi:hypothetical protein ZWY2020_010148 [Hordeum vulgare]|nr:hypothetical protein ZWY2020_010148 [Hordeum vulgare]
MPEQSFCLLGVDAGDDGVEEAVGVLKPHVRGDAGDPGCPSSGPGEATVAVLGVLGEGPYCRRIVPRGRQWIRSRAGSRNTLQGLAARHTDVLESLEPKVRKRVEALREIQV